MYDMILVQREQDDAIAQQRQGSSSTTDAQPGYNQHTTGNKRRGNISNENREDRTEIVQSDSEGFTSIAISEDLSYSLCDDHEEDFTIVSSPWEADLESDFESLVFVSQTIEPELTLPTLATDAKAHS